MARKKQQKVQAKKGDAVAALVFGIISIPAAIIPLFGLPLGIVGLILGILAKKQGRRFSKAALICSIIGLVLTVLNGTGSVYLGLA